MLFKLKEESKIEPLSSTWIPPELDLEKYILPIPQSDEPNILNREIFGEPLLPIRNQMKTSRGRKAKRADILAVDSLGNGVIIEIKRDTARMGVEIQALQYLADIAPYKGKEFISCFEKTYKYPGSLGDGIKGLGVQQIEDVNRYSRIILIARSFDPSLFSMGRWLADNKVAFRCIQYFPYEIGGEKYLSFSIVFDQSPPEIFPLSFLPLTREPQYFWHNIGNPETTMSVQKWWDHLIHNQEIRTSFSNQPGDEGERILREYKEGDTVIAYVSGHGAIGWGIVKTPDSYKLLAGDVPDDVLNGRMRHRLKVQWKSIIKNVNQGLSSQIIKQLGGHHPISTRVRIEDSVAKRIMEQIDNVSGYRQGS
jgi:hypothetical protein